MPAPPPVRLYAQLLLGVDLRAPSALQRLLELFAESPELAPTHWATLGGPRDPYSAKVIQQAVAKAGDDGIVPRIIRAVPPLTYSAEWFQCPDGPFLAMLKIESGDELADDLAKRFVGLVDCVAGFFPLEWGHIDMRQSRQDPSTYIKSSGTYDHPDYYLRVGPLTLFPRTYLGQRLLKLAPNISELVRLAGCQQESLASSALRFDLLPEPWRQAPSHLKAAQTELGRALDPTGIFARQTAARDFPGTAQGRPGCRQPKKTMNSARARTAGIGGTDVQSRRSGIRHYPFGAGDLRQKRGKHDLLGTQDRRKEPGRRPPDVAMEAGHPLGCLDGNHTGSDFPLVRNTPSAYQVSTSLPSRSPSDGIEGTTLAWNEPNEDPQALFQVYETTGIYNCKLQFLAEPGNLRVRLILDGMTVTSAPTGPRGRRPARTGGS